MSAQEQPRQPAGIPIGGEWAKIKAGRAAAAALGARPVSLVGGRPSLDIPAVRAGRRRLLNSLGFVPPRGTDAISDPRSAEGREAWWDYEFRAGEYGHSGGDYLQMPDDNTPSRTGGASLSGLRRTHRVAYAGSGVALRMPSATAVKRFAGQSRRATFDVPVQASFPGGTAQGWARVTRGGDGQWGVEPLGFANAEAGAYVSESVASVLEARRPTRALAEAGDLLARRKDRLATSGGAVMETPPSTWITGMGYDRQNSTLVMTAGGRRYGYSVPKETFAAIRSSARPGAVFNRLVRNKAARVPVAECGRCLRYYNESLGRHRCPAAPAPRDGTRSVQNRMARTRAQGL